VVALSWRTDLTADEVAQVRALLDAVTDVDSVAPVSEAFLLRLRADGRGGSSGGSSGASSGPLSGAEHLLAHDDGVLVGYAQLDGGEEPDGELAVHPEHRRCGIGGGLLAELLEHLAGGPLRLWAHGEHIGAIALAERYGLTRDRVLLQLRRELDRPPLDDAVFPDGVTIRPFVPGRDEPAVVEVNAKAFAWHPEQGRWTVDDVLVREEEPWFDPAGFLIAAWQAPGQEAEQLVGFHWTKVHDAAAGRGEVYVLAVDPAHHGLGLGTALTLAGLHHLRDTGMRTVTLYVEADNEAAIRTYQRLGFTHWDTDVRYSR